MVLLHYFQFFCDGQDLDDPVVASELRHRPGSLQLISLCAHQVPRPMQLHVLHHRDYFLSYLTTGGLLQLPSTALWAHPRVHLNHRKFLPRIPYRFVDLQNLVYLSDSYYSTA